MDITCPPLQLPQGLNSVLLAEHRMEIVGGLPSVTGVGHEQLLYTRF